MSVIGLIGEPALAAARSSLRAAEQVRAQLIALAGGAGKVRVHAELGSRHRLQLRFEGFDEVACGETFVALLPDHQFVIPGHSASQAAVVDVDNRVAANPLLTVTVELVLEED